MVSADGDVDHRRGPDLPRLVTAWAAHVAASGGPVVSGDPLDALDDHGLALTASCSGHPRRTRSPGS